VPQLPTGLKRAKAHVRPAVRKATSKWRSLPDFMIIGAQKAGTTSLYRYLRDHPDVLVEPGVGEIHYFDNHWDEGEAFFRSHFPRQAKIESQRTKTGKPVVTGEKTPYYLYHPLSPGRAAATVPAAKLIVLLRNPSERAASQHKMNFNMGLEPLSFAAAIDAEPQRIDATFQAIVEGAAPSGGGPVALYSYVGRGRYVEQLDRWLAHYRREQLLILRSEDLLTEPETTFATVLEFLGLDYQPVEFTRHNAARKPYAIDPAVRERLDVLFAEPNQELEERFGVSW
jgi:Sulfotransferase domain